MSVFYIPKYNCNFIHIPKTAGQSIRNIFFQKKYYGPYETVHKEHKKKFTFTFVRNPYTRFISAYTYINKYFNTIYDLNDFVDIVINENIKFGFSKRTRTLENKMTFIRHHTLPQSHPYYYISGADFIGKFENLNTDFKIVCNRLDVPFSILPKTNKSQYKIDIIDKIYNYWYPENKEINFISKFISKENLSILNTYYHSDFEKFDYEKIQDFT